MMGAVVFLYGVHGSGKSLLGKMFSDDENIRYFNVNDIERQIEIFKLHPLDRQLIFTYSLLKNTIVAFRFASEGHITMVDYGFAQIEAYTKWWIKKKSELSIVKSIIDQNYKRLIELYPNIKIVHIFLLVSSQDGYQKIIERLKNRRKPGLEEEINIDYIKFIDKNLKKISRDLRSRGERVHIIPAEKSYKEKYEMIRNAISDLIKQ